MNRWLWYRALVLCAASVAGAAMLTAQTTSVPIWRATEQWRVDGSESGEPFGDVRDLVVTRDGAVWVLDFKDQHIRRFSSAGRALETVSRKGSGPGELRNANGMVRHGDGTVWVNDPANSRFSVFAADGKFARQHVLPITGYTYRWLGAFDIGSGEILDLVFTPRKDIAGAAYRKVNASGSDVGASPVPSCPNGPAVAPARWKAETPKQGSSQGQYPFTAGGGLALNGRGAAWCASPSSRQVALVRIGTNDTIARTSVIVPPLPVSKAERDSMIALFEKRLASYATSDFDPSKVPTTKPGIQALHVDDDGRLWVEYTQVFASNRTVFDIHDARGVHLGRVTLPVSTVLGLPLRARGSLVWLPVRDEDDVVSVAQFTLTSPARPAR